MNVMRLVPKLWIAAVAICLLVPGLYAQDGNGVTLEISNPSDVARAQVAEVAWDVIATRLPDASAERVRVVEPESDDEVISQVVDLNADGEPDQLLVWGAVEPGATRSYRVEAAASRAEPVSRAYVMHHGPRDDVAWENDRIAFRTYGEGLWELEDLVSSGIDVFNKRTDDLVLDRWYASGDYHTDHGEGADFFKVGSSLGGGGTAAFVDGELYPAPNFRSHRVLASGPLRAIVEMEYGPWDAGDASVTERRRITIDRGQDFYRQETLMESDDDVSLAAGLVDRPGVEALSGEADGFRWIGYYGAVEDPGYGELGTAVLLDDRFSPEAVTTDDHQLLVVDSPADEPLVHYVGSCWSAAGACEDVAAWQRRITSFGSQLSEPLTLSVDGELVGAVSNDPISPELQWSERMALSEMRRTPDPRLLDFQERPKWEYTHGLVLRAIDQVWQEYPDDSYAEYVESYFDMMIDENGDIERYAITNFNIDRLNPGRMLITLHDRTGKEKYALALDRLRKHLEWQPRTTDGGFWHKLVYPWQMWLDGAYMGSTFYAEYAARYAEPESYDDIARQFILMDRHMRDDATGLMYHGWDESRTQRWADPVTGTSPNFWGRAMGWYAMALVDVLDAMPAEHARRDDLIDILDRLVIALINHQDEETGLWYQVVDQGEREGNYLEASASAMFVYSIAKGVNDGYLDARYMPIAERAYESILSELITVDEDGLVHLNQICAVAGLGGSPYRDGSYEYYVNEPIRPNDPKGVGPFILASLELDR